MITGIWKGVTLICGNKCHEDNQEMYVREISLEEEKAREKEAFEEQEKREEEERLKQEEKEREAHHHG